MIDIKNLTPMPPYFIVKVNKEELRKRREMIGSLYLSPDHVYMQRELQASEIVSIGASVKEMFPECQLGDQLIYHHFITGKADDKKHLFYYLGENRGNEYYAVTGMEIPGERNLCFGVWNGKEIIPHPDYIFLEVPKEEEGEDLGMPEVGKSFKMAGSGLAVIVERKKTRKQWVDVMTQNIERIKQLARNIPQNRQQEVMFYTNLQKREITNDSITEIKRLEQENRNISLLINKKTYELHTVAAVNPNLFEDGKEQILAGSKVYMLNIACSYEVEFMNKTYLVAPVKYFGCSEKWLRQSLQNFKQCQPQ